MEDRFFIANPDGMAGIVPSLKSHHIISLRCHDVDQFPFALIAPLDAKDDFCLAHSVTLVDDVVHANHSHSACEHPDALLKTLDDSQ